MTLQRAQRLRPDDAVHGQVMLSLEGANRAACLRAEDSVEWNAERALESFDCGASAPRLQEGASLLAYSGARKGCPCLRADDAVCEETVLLLKRAHSSTCPRSEDAVRVDAEGALYLSDCLTTAAEAQELDVHARHSRRPSPAVGNALDGERGRDGGNEE